MSREKPRDLYITKVTKFGNGAKIKGYKKHIGQEVIVMNKEEFNKQCKNKDLIKQYKQSLKDGKKKWTDKDDKELDKLEEEEAEKLIKKDLY